MSRRSGMNRMGRMSRMNRMSRISRITRMARMSRIFFKCTDCTVFFSKIVRICFRKLYGLYGFF